MKTALLLSGGMDSMALAFWKRPQVAITIDYGQLPADAERNASNSICVQLGIEHHVITVDLRSLGSGDLAGLPPAKSAPVSEWWPFRNQMLVTLAAMKLISHDVSEIMIGALRTDCQHVDGTLLYLRALGTLLEMQEGSIQLTAPAVEMTGAELVERSGIPEDMLAWAHSCHIANLACGRCRGCQKHYQTLQLLGREAY